MAETPDEADRRLLQRVGAGEREALAELYARYRDLLYRYLLRLTPSREQAEDLLHDAFVAIWRSAGTYQGRSTVRTWLIGVASRQAHNTLRRRVAPTADLEALASLESAEPDPADAAIASATRAELRAAMQRLSLAHREALTLFFGQNLSLNEIATTLDIPLGTVKSRLRDGKRALRALLGAGKVRFE